MASGQLGQSNQSAAAQQFVSQMRFDTLLSTCIKILNSCATEKSCVRCQRPGSPAALQEHILRFIIHKHSGQIINVLVWLPLNILTLKTFQDMSLTSFLFVKSLPTCLLLYSFDLLVSLRVKNTINNFPVLHFSAFTLHTGALFCFVLFCLHQSYMFKAGV